MTIIKKLNQMKNKLNKSQKAGKLFKAFTKYFLIFALCYFVGRTLTSILFGI